MKTITDRKIVLPNLAKGYRYLPNTELVSCISFKQWEECRLNEHPLIKEIDKFDVTYDYSDSNSVVAAGRREEKRLRDKIAECSEQFSLTEMKALASGLTMNRDLFRETFPISNLPGYLDSDNRNSKENINSLSKLCRALVLDTYVEDDLQRAQAMLDTLVPVFDSIPKYTRLDPVVRTKKCKIKAQEIEGKCTVSSNAQALVYEFEREMTDELLHALTLLPYLTFYGVVEKAGGRVYESMSGLPSEVNCQTNRLPNGDTVLSMRRDGKCFIIYI